MKSTALLAACLSLLLVGCSHAPSFERENPASLVRQAVSLEPTTRLGLVVLADPRLAHELDAASRRSESFALIAPITDAEYVAHIAVTRRARSALSSFLICFPGFYVFAPAWHGLDWPYEIEARVQVCRANGASIADYVVDDHWTAHYTPFARGTLAELGWLLPPYPFLAIKAGALSALEPPDLATLDDAFATDEAPRWADEVVTTLARAIARDRGSRSGP